MDRAHGNNMVEGPKGHQMPAAQDGVEALVLTWWGAGFVALGLASCACAWMMY